jgi:bifunctional DNA-binding transcriptional regulator/antitoxin component of YhaV-PrlF toxin-antitoxin module
MVSRIMKVDKRGRIAMAKALKEAGIRPPVRCLVSVEKEKITVKPLPKMAERGFGIFKASEPIGDVDEILKKMKPEL